MTFAATAIGVGVAGSVGAQAYFGGKASRRAAKAAREAAYQLKLSKDRAVGYQRPYETAGRGGLDVLTGLLTGKQYAYSGENNSQVTTTDLSPEQRLALFQASPGYQFRLDQATKNLQASQAARGGLLSGGAAKELTQYSQGIASDEYNNYLNSIMGLAGIGQQASTNMGNYELGAGSQIADYTQAAGLAQAQGYANTGNAIAGGFNTISGIGGLMLGNGGTGGGANGSNFSSAGGGQYNNSYFSNPNPSMYTLK